MTLFCKVVETKIEGPRGSLTRFLKCTVVESNELINYCIQLSHDKGYKYVKYLLKTPMETPTRFFLYIEKR